MLHATCYMMNATWWYMVRCPLFMVYCIRYMVYGRLPCQIAAGRWAFRRALRCLIAAHMGGLAIRLGAPHGDALFSPNLTLQPLGKGPKRLKAILPPEGRVSEIGLGQS